MTTAPHLRKPVLDMVDICTRTAFLPKADHHLQPLLHLLAELAGRMMQEYQQEIRTWMQEYPDYAPLMDWLQKENYLLADYLELLCSNTTPTGVEVLAAMMAL